MKSLQFLYCCFGITLILLLSGSCEDKVKMTETYMANTPIYMDSSEFRTQKSVSTAQEMTEPGKICMYGNYLFINEISKGIHIIDNSDPAAPKNVGFLEIIGNVEMAVVDHYLFADSYKDLVCFDITNPAKPITSSRTQNAFPYVLPPTDNQYPIDEIDEKQGIVIGWEVKKITKTKEPYNPGPIICYDYLSDASSWNSLKGGSTKTTAITGSMSRFAVNGNYLYAIDKNNYEVKIFQLNGNTANLVNCFYSRGSVETAFCYNDLLFFGTPSGMIIFSLEDAQNPEYLSFSSHVMGCDPVVVQGNYAYLTVRSGNFCGQNNSVLGVVDITNPVQPTSVATFNMKEPYGLSIDGDKLFVCDEGLKIFDASNPRIVGTKLLKTFTNMHGYDVIAYNNLLMLIGSDGLYQYDYADVNNIHLLSSITIKK